MDSSEGVPVNTGFGDLFDVDGWFAGPEWKLPRFATTPRQEQVQAKDHLRKSELEEEFPSVFRNRPAFSHTSFGSSNPKLLVPDEEDVQRNRKSSNRKLLSDEPEIRFQALTQLEQDIFARCKLLRIKETILSTSDALNEPVIPDWFSKEARMYGKSWVSGLSKAETKMTVDFANSYNIMMKVQSSLTQMRNIGFCTNSISIFMAQSDTRIAKLMPVPFDHIETIQTNLQLAKQLILHKPSLKMFSRSIKPLIYSPCARILETLGLDDAIIGGSPSVQAALDLLRTTALLLDVALISYAGSHVATSWRAAISPLSVRFSADCFAFSCSKKRLTCLDTFLMHDEVLIFQCFPPSDLPIQEDAAGFGDQLFSVLTRIQEFADIWGPVYTASNAAGQIIYHYASTGIIYRLPTQKPSTVGNAVPCHFELCPPASPPQAPICLPEDPDYLTGNDLLLIGAPLWVRDCQFEISHLRTEYSRQLKPLGTKPAVWQRESLTFGVSLSKVVGISVAGTKKFNPQTTVKQFQRNQWTMDAANANPQFFNKWLGVEYSHCTGNARRVPLRYLLSAPPFSRVLERRQPGWSQTSWGLHLRRAFTDDDDRAIHMVWEHFYEDREKIAGVLCCALRILDSTGFQNDRKLHIAVLCEDEEDTLPLPLSGNEWAYLLRDTDTTAAYVLMNKACLLPGPAIDSILSCYPREAHTILQTQFNIERRYSTWSNRALYSVEPTKEKWKVVTTDVSTTVTLKLAPTRYSLVHPGPTYTCKEEIYQNTSSTATTVYLEASSHTWSGRERPEPDVRLHEVGSLEERADLPSREDSHRLSASPQDDSVGRISHLQGGPTPTSSQHSGTYSPNAQPVLNLNSLGSDSLRSNSQFSELDARIKTIQDQSTREADLSPPDSLPSPARTITLPEEPADEIALSDLFGTDFQALGYSQPDRA